MNKYNLNKHKLFYCYALISIIIFSLLVISCRSSDLNNTSSSNIPVDVYVGGNAFISSTNVPVAVYWKNGEMVTLSTEYSRVTSIAVKGNDVYAGGNITKYDPSIPSEYEVADIAVPGFWKNGELVGLSVLHSKKNSSVKTMFIYGDDIYAGGYSTNRSGTDVAGYWENKKWVGLTSNSKYDSCVNSIFVTDNDVYACGYMRGKGIEIPVYWKNGECVELPFLSEKKYGEAKSIFVLNNDVYISGSSMNNSRVITACYWKNGEIIPLLSYEPQYSSDSVSIFVSGGDVYIGGKYTESIRIRPVAGYWKNSKWIALMPVDEDKTSYVTSIFVFGKDVYVAGFINMNIPGYWKNGEWVGFNARGGYSPVTSIVVVPKPIDK